MPGSFSGYRNLLHYPSEHWRPPFYYRPHGRLQKLKTFFYQFFDLQAGTIYLHLSACLPTVEGDVLDVGCGIQPYRHLFPPEARYKGLDTIDSKKKFGYAAPDTVYFSGKKWPQKDRSVDFILCTETLEHVPDTKTFLREAYRCLRPGGTVLFTIPFEARWHFIPYDYWRFTPSGLELIFGQAGFSSIKVFGRGNQLTVVCYKAMAFVWSLLNPLPSNFFLRATCRIIGCLSLPLFFGAVLLANLTLWREGRVESLGYTLLAQRPGRGAAQGGRA